ncbi:MAG: ribosome recycling factor [Candidatus Wallbacteria bacterium]|nr:ribosome recycling factor [Candidatus Wallbacteria bacterium]
MLKGIYHEMEDKSKKTVEAIEKEYMNIRTGRANPALLHQVKVDYYGSPTPINQLAGIGAPEPRLLVVNPYDKGIIKEIEKAITAANLGVTPASDGKTIRVSIPALTEERRKDLVKQVSKKNEEAKVGIRNIRRTYIEKIKDLEKKSEITEDDQKKGTDEIQKLTDKYIAVLESVCENKKKEIMEF